MTDWAQKNDRKTWNDVFYTQFNFADFDCGRNCCNCLISINVFCLMCEAEKSRTVIKNVIMVSIFIYLIASLTEVTMKTAYLYLLFILAANMDEISFDRELRIMKD